MLKESVEYLAPAPGGVYLDATVGAGGHTRGILESAGPAARVVAVDQDTQALVFAKKQLADLEKQVMFVHGNFKELDALLAQCGVHELDGALLDLGVSSMQLDSAQRGFSFRENGPLDMRMDSEAELSAQEIVNRWSEQDIAQIIFEYGQERWSRRIARNIVAARPITTTEALVRAVLKAMPRGRGWQKIHPATRTFQALRIAVNQELEILENLIPKVIERLKPNGRVVIISYHSLEDRIVKRAFLAAAKGSRTMALGLLAAARTEKFFVLTRKPIRPTDREVQENPRSRSARLRAGEKRVP
ncbi:MAG: 16S rRNA (cytosine(1402)-N(4))-methyltransferase RsmH [Candidatus Omnitrophica bacterium]|nr:16S rRNA (cytosine(1402)-N(4))-methyltransferase RsmH [Candidatus Omnitrophota bacterium]